MPGTHRASRDARRHAFRFGKVFVINTINTKRALLHDAFARIILSGTIRAGPRAKFAPDAQVFVDQHDAVFFTLVGRARWTNGDAKCVVTVQA